MKKHTKYHVTRQIIALMLFLLSNGVFADNANRMLGDTQYISGSRNTKVNKSDLSIKTYSLPSSLQQQNSVDVSVVRLIKNYEFIFFYSTDCPHCMSFDLVLKAYSDSSGIAVKSFMLGNKSSPSFPNSIAIAQEIVDQFFGKGAKLSVPTLFILNKDNYHAYPVSSGALTYLELNARMNQLAPKILMNERSDPNA